MSVRLTGWFRVGAFLALACGLAVWAASGAASQPEIEFQVGSEVQLSTMGRDRDPNFDAEDPEAAYAPEAGVYLVVWRGDDSRDGDYELYGQLVDAETGQEVGEDDVRISVTGRSVGSRSGAQDPAIVYNAAKGEFLVVWSGDDLADDDFEIYGQRLDASTGTEVGEDDFKISTTGKPMDPSARASHPDVAYNPQAGEYLVVWEARNESGEIEVYGQRLDAATGAEVGEDDFRISTTGPDGDRNHAALSPAVAYNPDDNQYLVAWLSYARSEGDGGPGAPDQEPQVTWSSHYIILDATAQAPSEAVTLESPGTEWAGGSQARYHSGRGFYTASYRERGETVHSKRVVREVGRDGSVVSTSRVDDDKQAIDESTASEADGEIDYGEDAAAGGLMQADPSSPGRRLIVTRAVANQEPKFTLRQLHFARTPGGDGWATTPSRRVTLAADGGFAAMAPLHPRWQVVDAGAPGEPAVHRLSWLTVYHKEVDESEVFGVITTITRTVSAETPTPAASPTPTPTDVPPTAPPEPTGSPTEPTEPTETGTTLYVPKAENGGA